MDSKSKEGTMARKNNQSISSETEDGGAFLSLDAGTEYLQLCLSMPGSRGRIRHIRVLDAGLRHVEGMMPEIEKLLSLGGISPGELDGLITGRGPGSFTGLRIAMAAMKGLSSALNIPLISISALDAIAWKYRHSRAMLTAAIDARKSRYYCAAWNFHSSQPIPEPHGNNYREILDYLKDRTVVKAADLLPGEVGIRLNELRHNEPSLNTGGKRESSPEPVSVPIILGGPHGASLAAALNSPEVGSSGAILHVLPFDEWVSSMDELGRLALASGIRDPESLGPEYLRSSEAEIHR